MKVLSGRQPWWWAIMATDLPSPKRIENRRWNTHYRGPILLHAAKGCTLDEVDDALHWMGNQGLLQRYEDWPGLHNVPRGGIVGRARIVDVIPPIDGMAPAFRVAAYPPPLDGRWHMHDQYGFVLEDVEPLPFYPCKGMLGLWEFDESLLKGAV
jgi:hypothetical protein